MTKEELEREIHETKKRLRELKEKEAFKKESEEQLKAIEELKELKEKGELTGLGVGGKPRAGEPKTEEERQATHEGTLPPRGTGLGFEATGLKPEGGDIHGTPGVKKAAEIQTPQGNQRGIIVLWSDDHVTTILGSEEGHGSAYTTSKPEGIHAYYISCAWAANLGHKIKPIPVEAATEEALEAAKERGRYGTR